MKTRYLRRNRKMKRDCRKWPMQTITTSIKGLEEEIEKVSKHTALKPKRKAKIHRDPSNQFKLHRKIKGYIVFPVKPSQLPDENCTSNEETIDGEES